MKTQKTIIYKLLASAFVMIGIILMGSRNTYAALAHPADFDNLSYFDDEVTLSGSYPNYTITAIPRENRVFLRWICTGDLIVGNGDSLSTSLSVESQAGGNLSIVDCIIHTTVTPSNSGSVSFSSNGGVGNPLTFTATPESGYVFDHWEVGDSSVGTNSTYSITVPDMHHYYITAVFADAPTYTITFDPNGGNFNGSTTAVTRTTRTDGTLTAFPEVQYDGHTLVGWFDEATSTTTRVELDKVYTGATTLKAHWTETPSYHTVTYRVVNGKWDDDNSTNNKTEGDILHGSSPNHVPAVGSKPNSGYKAGSWDTNPRTAIITANTTFTYTYVSDTPSSSSKKSDDSDHYESSPAPAPKPVNPNAIISTSFSFKNPAVNSSFGKGVIKIGPQEQGTAAQLAFRLNTPAGWREAFSFNMTVNNKTNYDPKTGTLSFTIPTRYQKDGRKFAILGIDQDGKVKIFYDKDATADTITVNLFEFPGYAFDLIYVD